MVRSIVLCSAIVAFCCVACGLSCVAAVPAQQSTGEPGSTHVSELGLYCVNSAGQVVVTSVEARSGAQAAGLAAGDVILDVDGTNLTDAGGLKSLVSGRSTVLLQVARGSQKFFATVAVAPQFEMRRR